MARNNKTLVPEAKAALDQFKMEAASEVGVTLNQGYNGDLTSKQAGSIGGQMVKKMVEIAQRCWISKAKVIHGEKSAESRARSPPLGLFSVVGGCSLCDQYKRGAVC